MKAVPREGAERSAGAPVLPQSHGRSNNSGFSLQGAADVP